MIIDVWAPRMDHPGRKAAPMANPKELDIEKNPPGCRGLRNPPRTIKMPDFSTQLRKKALLILKEERAKHLRMKKALR